MHYLKQYISEKKKCVQRPSRLIQNHLSLSQRYRKHVPHVSEHPALKEMSGTEAMSRFSRTLFPIF